MSSGIEKTLELVGKISNSKQTLADTLELKGEDASVGEPLDDLVEKAGDYMPKSYLFVDDIGGELEGVLVQKEEGEGDMSTAKIEIIGATFGKEALDDINGKLDQVADKNSMTSVLNKLDQLIDQGGSGGGSCSHNFQSLTDIELKNAAYTITPADKGCDAFSSVLVPAIPASGGESVILKDYTDPEVGNFTVNNKEYKASDYDCDGFSSVKVAVPEKTIIPCPYNVSTPGKYYASASHVDGFSEFEVVAPTGIWEVNGDLLGELMDLGDAGKTYPIPAGYGFIRIAVDGFDGSGG